MARKFEERKAKPSNDAYTGMLLISFVALLIGCGLLYLDYSQYDAKGPPKIDTKNVGAAPKIDAEPRKAKEGDDKEKEKDTPQPGEPKDKDKDIPPDKGNSS
jgi:hypothetical protein